MRRVACYIVTVHITLLIILLLCNCSMKQWVTITIFCIYSIYSLYVQYIQLPLWLEMTSDVCGCALLINNSNAVIFMANDSLHNNYTIEQGYWQIKHGNTALLWNILSLSCIVACVVHVLNLAMQ